MWLPKIIRVWREKARRYKTERQLNMDVIKQTREIEDIFDATGNIIKAEHELDSMTKLKLVSDFLLIEVGLTYEQREKLLQRAPHLAQASVDYDLVYRKKIFDKYNLTNSIFLATKDDEQEIEKANLLKTNLFVIYSKLKFFNENSKKLGVKITDKNFIEIIGMPHAFFLREYVYKIYKKGKESEIEYAREIADKFKEKYPFPKNEKEFDEELDKITQ